MAESAAAPERTLPHNLEAERSVLGAILIDNEAFNVAAAVINGAAFFRDAHRRIFERMIDLAERSQPIDLVTLKEALDAIRRSRRSRRPGLHRLARRRRPARHQRRALRANRQGEGDAARLIFSANKILSNAYEADQEADLILDEAESAIFAVADDRIKTGFVPMRDLVKRQLPENRAALRAQELHHRRRRPASTRSTR